MSQEIRNDVLNLMQQKDKIEEEIRQLTAILVANGVGMDDPLVDAEGFPKNNIDVYQVRHARHKIICWQNDHKNIMKQIENGLQGYYSTANCSNTCSQDVEMSSATSNLPPLHHEKPFARISVVAPGSPADVAGLRANDFVVEFGSVNATNFKNITDVAAVVQHSEGNQVPVKVRRGHNLANVTLVPKRWHGKGLLGCNIECVEISL